MSMNSYCMFMHLHRASWHSSATLSEGFPYFFLSCKANASVKPAKKGHGPHSSKIFVFFYVLFVLCRSVYCLCKCVLYYCHRVATQLHLTNTSHIISYHITSLRNLKPNGKRTVNEVASICCKFSRCHLSQCRSQFYHFHGMDNI